MNFAPAQFMLGKMYSNGEGLEVNHEEAEKWMQKAANQDHTSAKKWLDERLRARLVVATEQFLRNNSQDN